jgi:hypothetical protein
MHGQPDPRPEFMITLGLAPPYAREDVKQAYLEKAKQAHPDRGGSTAAFNAVHQAFERAQEYLSFRDDRRAWIAQRMNRYVALQNAIGRLQQLGATVETRAPEWLEHSFGDFAQLTEAAVKVRAVDAEQGDAIIAALVAEHAALRDLVAIELPGCRVTDDAVLTLAVFQMLRRLNLAGTPVTRRSIGLVDAIPTLAWVAVDGTRVGWWPRWRLAARLRRRSGTL